MAELEQYHQLKAAEDAVIERFDLVQANFVRPDALDVVRNSLAAARDQLIITAGRFGAEMDALTAGPVLTDLVDSAVGGVNYQLELLKPVADVLPRDEYADARREVLGSISGEVHDIFRRHRYAEYAGVILDISGPAQPAPEVQVRVTDSATDVRLDLAEPAVETHPEREPIPISLTLVTSDNQKYLLIGDRGKIVSLSDRRYDTQADYTEPRERSLRYLIERQGEEVPVTDLRDAVFGQDTEEEYRSRAGTQVRSWFNRLTYDGEPLVWNNGQRGQMSRYGIINFEIPDGLQERESRTAARTTFLSMAHTKAGGNITDDSGALFFGNPRLTAPDPTETAPVEELLIQDFSISDAAYLAQFFLERVEPLAFLGVQLDVEKLQLLVEYAAPVLRSHAASDVDTLELRRVAANKFLQIINTDNGIEEIISLERSREDLYALAEPVFQLDSNEKQSKFRDLVESDAVPPRVIYEQWGQPIRPAYLVDNGGSEIVLDSKRNFARASYSPMEGDPFAKGGAGAFVATGNPVLEERVTQVVLPEVADEDGGLLLQEDEITTTLRRRTVRLTPENAKPADISDHFEPRLEELFHAVDNRNAPLSGRVQQLRQFYPWINPQIVHHAISHKIIKPDNDGRVLLTTEDIVAVSLWSADKNKYALHQRIVEGVTGRVVSSLRKRREAQSGK